MKVIFDTDIGDDIDDIWALGLLLSCEEVQLDLITVCFADIKSYKIKVLEEILTRFACKTIKIGAGRDLGEGKSNCSAHPFVKNTARKKDYPDAVQAIKEVLDNSKEHVYILSVGPATNIADFSMAYPNYKDKYNVIAMAGAYKKGYLNQDKPSAEFNVLMDIDSANIAYLNTSYTMLPLDVCRDIIIDDKRYLMLLQKGTPISKEILKAYCEWQNNYFGDAIKFDIGNSSSILYDIIPVHYLLQPESYTVINKKVIATHDGRIILNENYGFDIRIATYADRESALDFAVAKLTVQF